MATSEACSTVRCAGCPFGGRLVGSRGPIDSPFVIIGESPGSDDLKSGQPFSGPPSQVLKMALDQLPAGSYPEPLILNAFKCYAGSKKKPETVLEAVQSCHKTVDQELKAHPRKVILALGNAGLWAATGQYSTKITQVRGKVFDSPYAEKGVVASVHPSYLLRGSGSLRQFKSDVAYALSLLTGGERKQFIEPSWRVLQTPNEIAYVTHNILQYAQHHNNALDITGDIETSGFSHLDDVNMCLGFTVDARFVYIIPEHLMKYAKTLMEHHYLRWNWHNGKFDVKFFYSQGIQARVDNDTMLLSYALDETRGIHDLETVSNDWLGSPNWKNMLESHLPKKSSSYSVIPKPVLYEYLAKDCVNTHNLLKTLRPLVDVDKVSAKLYYRTLIPASTYLAQVENNGLLVDKERVKDNWKAKLLEANGYKEQLFKIASEVGEQEITEKSAPFNTKMCNSPKQLQMLLFDLLKLPSKVRATDEDTLNTLPKHPAVVALMKYRKVHKGLSTYVKPLYDGPIDPKFLEDDVDLTENPEMGKAPALTSDGRVHPQFLIHGTATGRLASRNPNVQNIPRDPLLRGQYVAPPGYIYLEPDLNQAELRSLACLSGDDALCAVYTTEGVSLHEEVRAEIFGYAKDWSEQQLMHYFNQFSVSEVERVLEEQKMRAKNVNFGIVYGITPFGLADQTESTPQEAAKWLAAWARKYPKAWGFIQMCRNAPLRGQNLVTVFGHRKRIGIVTPEILGNIQNEAANFPHQSTASTVMLQAGILLWERMLKEYDSRIVNTVHDSMLIEVPDDVETIKAVNDLVCSTLEQIPRDWGITRIPFQADSKIGTRWGSLKGYDKWLKSLEAA